MWADVQIRSHPDEVATQQEASEIMRLNERLDIIGVSVVPASRPCPERSARLPIGGNLEWLKEPG